MTAPPEDGSPRPRSWSLNELRTAAFLSHGGTLAHPAVADLADDVGVSSRTVRRWLAGASQPRPENAARLRAALLPSAAILAHQRDERRFAASSAVAMAAPRGRGIDRVWRDRGWHTPHRLWHLRHERLHAERLMITLVSPVKPTPRPPGWEVVATIVYPNRSVALLGKFEILDQVADYRVVLNRALANKGRTDCWLDTAPHVDITTLDH